MKLFIKLIISVVIIIAITVGLLFTPQGKEEFAKLLTSSGGISTMIEKEMLSNINKAIDLSLPVTVQGYNTKIGDFITDDTLILPFRDDCPPCDELINKMASQDNIRFMVLGFNDSPFPKSDVVTNRLMTFATTNLQPENFYMDSMLSPILFHIDSSGVIKKKYIGLDEKNFSTIVSAFKG